MSGQSDPFVEVRVGYLGKTYKTKVVEDAANPVWNEETMAFPVYTLFQKVHCFITDSDFWTPNDAIGGLKDCYIYDIIQDTAAQDQFDRLLQDYHLYKKDGTRLEDSRIKLAFEWKELAPASVATMKSLKTLKADIGSFPVVLSVLIDKVIGKSNFLQESSGQCVGLQLAFCQAGFTVKCQIPMAGDEIKEFESSYARKEDGYTGQFIYKRVLKGLTEPLLAPFQIFDMDLFKNLLLNRSYHGTYRNTRYPGIRFDHHAVSFSRGCTASLQIAASL
eukprot:g2902.t1